MSRAHRLPLALVVALAATVVLSARVSVRFEPHRVKIVDGQPVKADGSVVLVDVDSDRAVRAAPGALIARIRNHASNAQTFVIGVNGGPICDATVDGLATERIDCATAHGLDTPTQVEIRGDGESWQLQYLEIATHHGATRGHDLLILPAVSSRHAAPSLLVLCLACVGIFAVFLIPPPSMGRFLRATSRVGAGGVTVLFALLLLSPVVSPYLLVISLGTFWLCIGIVAAPRLVVAAKWALHHPVRMWRTAALGAAIVAVVAVTYGSVTTRLLTEHYRGNYSGFLRLAVANVDRHPVLSGRQDVRQTLLMSEDTGYDGQFAYFVALDPLLRAFADSPEHYGQFIDAPSYRYARVGFSALTSILGRDDWIVYPVIMVWLVLSGIAVSALSLMSIAGYSGSNRAAAFLVVLVPGFWQSIQVALPEPIAAAFLLSGFACYLRGRQLLAACLFAVSLMVRETGAIFVLCLVASDFIAGTRRKALLLAVVSLAPVALWRLYVAWILFPAFGVEAIWHETGDFGVPFAGFAELWSHILRGAYFPTDGAFARAGIWYTTVLSAGLALAAWLTLRHRGPVVAAALAYGLVGVSLTFGKIWAHVGNGQRGTYELFLMLALVSITRYKELPPGPRRALVMFWSAVAGYVFVGAFDAEYVRQAIAGTIRNAAF